MYQILLDNTFNQEDTHSLIWFFLQRTSPFLLLIGLSLRAHWGSYMIPSYTYAIQLYYSLNLNLKSDASLFNTYAIGSFFLLLFIFYFAYLKRKKTLETKLFFCKAYRLIEKIECHLNIENKHKGIEEEKKAFIPYIGSFLLLFSGGWLLFYQFEWIHLENNFGWEDTRTFIWAFAQTTFPFILFASSLLKANRLFYLFPWYIASILFVQTFDIHIKWYDPSVQFPALFSVILFLSFLSFLSNLNHKKRTPSIIDLILFKIKEEIKYILFEPNNLQLSLVTLDLYCASHNKKTDHKKVLSILKKTITENTSIRSGKLDNKNIKSLNNRINNIIRTINSTKFSEYKEKKP